MANTKRPKWEWLLAHRYGSGKVPRDPHPVDRCECGHNKRKHTRHGCPYCGYDLCSKGGVAAIKRRKGA
jgi:hypothetical protein